MDILLWIYLLYNIHTSVEYLTKVQFALEFAMMGKEGMGMGRAKNW